MEHETPEELRSRAQRLYNEGIIGSGRLRSMLRSADASEDANRALTRDTDVVGLRMSDAGHTETVERREVA